MFGCARSAGQSCGPRPDRPAAGEQQLASLIGLDEAPDHVIEPLVELVPAAGSFMALPPPA
jgi:hypothetical protein